MNKQRHPQQLSTHANLRAELRHLREVREALHGHIVQVCEISIYARTTQPAIENELTAIPASAQEMAVFRPSQVPAQLHPHAVSLFGRAIMQQVHAWLRQASTPGHPPKLVSWVQLYADFNLATGHSGPVKAKGQRWSNPLESPNSGLVQTTYTQRAQWFAAMIKTFLRAPPDPFSFSLRPPSQHGRPRLAGMCLSGVAPCRLHAIDE